MLSWKTSLSAGLVYRMCIGERTGLGTQWHSVRHLLHLLCGQPPRLSEGVRDNRPPWSGHEREVCPPSPPLGHQELRGMLPTVPWILPWLTLVVSTLHPGPTARSLSPFFSPLLSRVLSFQQYWDQIRALPEVSESSQRAT